MKDQVKSRLDRIYNLLLCEKNGDNPGATIATWVDHDISRDVVFALRKCGMAVTIGTTEYRLTSSNLVNQIWISSWED